MGHSVFTPSDGKNPMSPIVYIGQTGEFRDMYIPKPEKNEWGVDVLKRQLRGDPTAFDKFYGGLSQKTQFMVGGVTYYLQTWNVIEDRVFPGADLIYKGFSAGIPNALVSGGQVELSGTITVSSPQKASRNLRYQSWRTMYRYILNRKPTGPKYTDIDVDIDPRKLVTASEITDANGTPIFGNAPAALVIALTPVGYYPVATLDSYNPIIGTPYYECQDTATRYLPIQ